MKWTEARVADLLMRRYPGPAYAFLTQVRNTTGHAKKETYADAVAMSCYPSRGLVIHGFEIKVARQDWLKELAHPSKSEPIMRHCDYWWIVAPEGVVEESEVPETWGYQVAAGRRLRDVKKAPKLSPGELTRGFVASLLRNATAGVVSEEIAASRQAEAMEKLREELSASGDAVDRSKSRALDEIRDRVRSFEQATGIPVITGHAGISDPRIGKVIQAISWEEGMGDAETRKRLLRLAENRLEAAQKLRDKVEGLIGGEKDTSEEG